jgi:hypothetical protein
MAFAPQADLLLHVSSGPPGPAGPPGGHLQPRVKAVIELHSASPPHRAAMATAPSPMPQSLYGRPLPLFNLSYNHNLQPLFPPPF